MTMMMELLVIWFSSVIAQAATASAGTSSSSNSSDYDKLLTAVREITTKFHTVEAILQTFGVSNLPVAQRYGILFGCITFVTTILTVVLLLFLGGTFTRIAKQSNNSTNDHSNVDATSTPSDIRQQRSLLYEELLEQRQRMMLRYTENKNKPSMTKKNTVTELTNMLCNVAPPSLTKDSHPTTVSPRQQSGYETNYAIAYRQCQDRPGGSIISGHPEARYEAYARGYASCGHGYYKDSNNNNNTGNTTTTTTTTTTTSYPVILDTSYRRSYGRMVESISCENHSTVDYYHTNLFINRPCDIIGTYIRLEPLLQSNTTTSTTTDQDHHHRNSPTPPSRQQPSGRHHVSEIYHSTCTGEATMEYLKSYNPFDVWCFHDDGPFRTIDDVQQSKYLFLHVNNKTTPNKSNTAAFVIRQNITEHFIGCIMLLNDEPEDLSIQLQIPFVVPKYQPSTCKECMEGYFLIMDRLFAYGYRRIYMLIDTQDIQSMQFVHRMGFTHEGCLYKHRVVKDANRNSNIYAILNSDWKQSIMGASSGSASNSNSFSGARAALFQKLYGTTKFRADQSNERHEAEQEQQARGLLEQKMKQQEAQAQNESESGMATAKKYA